MQDMVGQKLGSYTLTLWLGEGAHVHAFLAKKRNTKKPLVIKVLKDTLARTEEYFSRFDQEAQAALALTHPNIVKVLDYKREGDTLYLVEEFMPGGSLMDIFAKQPGPLPMEQIIRVLQDIAAALDYAHAQGIIHRDMKPENVLFDEKGRAALSDLGITKTVNPQLARSKQDLEFGNPKYMSPEEWQGKEADPRTDIYALGVILFEMLTGQLPFAAGLGDSFVYVHLMHMMSTPLTLRELRPDLPRSVDAVVAKAIEKDRDSRYATAGELADAFVTALEAGDSRSEDAADSQVVEAQHSKPVSGLFAAAGARTPRGDNGSTPSTPPIDVGSASTTDKRSSAEPPLAAVQAAPAASEPMLTRAEYDRLLAEIRAVNRRLGILAALLMFALVLLLGKSDR